MDYDTPYRNLTDDEWCALEAIFPDLVDAYVDLEDSVIVVSYGPEDNTSFKRYPTTILEN